MKRFITLMGVLCLVVSSFAQQDSTNSNRVDTIRNGELTIDSTTISADTIRVGNMIIIKDRKSNHGSEVNIVQHSSNDNVTTSWFAFDIGFSRFNDNTDYAAAVAGGLLPAGANGDWFDLRNGKSVNIDIWFVNQRVNLVKHALNLKYSVGLELNNYRYAENILYQKDGPPLVIMSSKDFRKNKLAADYLTVPVMLNFNFRPGHQKQFDISAGISVGYLYSSRQKTVGGGDGKRKYKDNFEMRPWKLAYVGEIGIGEVKLYGSYAFKSMFKNTLDQTPFTIGVRISSPQ